ncbi:hypothetical protein [Desulfobacter postgatei]|uniref:hypothetical protein n=1 Tax=Desulfobacter postgatei TaxID=2293 RepID=UPI00259B1D01|nr:hypothetical protein [uncultured Desulfobacter sp.]
MKNIMWRSLGILCVMGLAMLLGCATSAPSVRETTYPGRSDVALFNYVVQSLSAGGYDIRSKDETSGVVQAFRPMTGLWSKPGYGHRVNLSILEGKVKITVFPMEGVAGGESPEEIQEEITRLLGGS